MSGQRRWANHISYAIDHTRIRNFQLAISLIYRWATTNHLWLVSEWESHNRKYMKYPWAITLDSKKDEKEKEFHGYDMDFLKCVIECADFFCYGVFPLFWCFDSCCSFCSFSFGTCLSICVIWLGRTFVSILLIFLLRYFQKLINEKWGTN